MLQRLCLLVFSRPSSLRTASIGLALVLFAVALPSLCTAEEGSDPAPKPAPAGESEPAEGAPTEEAPSTDGAKPKEETPPTGEPKPEGKPPAEDAEGRSTTGAAPADTNAPAAVPAGMAYVQGGRVRIGSEREYLDGILAGRPPLTRKLFDHERPPHHVFLRPYFIGKFEVTNAQYHRHLQDYILTYSTASGSLANIDEIAGHMVELSKEHQNERHQVVWSQLYFSNKEIIWKAFEKRLEELIVKNVDGEIDEMATARKFRFLPLPRTLTLKFYSIRMPQNWPSMDVPKGEDDHPVRFVSFNDVERFAEWAGMHIPSEQEWEWAARGPEGRIFPWGNDWPRTELYANWGGKITNAAWETMTLPVGTRGGSNPEGKAEDEEGKTLAIDGDGRSWCGCHHMVGNVAEFTSSWFKAYPGDRNKNLKMGTWIKILRGGSAADQEMLALRPACRNWVGGGPDAPAYPDAYFKWAGFRVAAFMKSGRDQLGPIARRATRAQLVMDSALDLDRFVGSVTNNWIASGAEPENHVYVLGRSHAVVLLPLKRFIRDDGDMAMPAMKAAWNRPMRKVNAISRKASVKDPFWIMGVLHTDIALEPVLVRKVEKIVPGKKPKKKGRRKGRIRAPETENGRCLPGTYLLANWFGKLALLTPGKEFVCFLPKADPKQKAFEIAKVKTADRKAPMLNVDVDTEWADFEFDIALGGKGVSDDARLITRGRLQFEFGALEEAGTWVQQDPAKGLADSLYASFLVEQEKEAKARKKQKKTRKKKKSKKANSSSK